MSDFKYIYLYCQKAWDPYLAEVFYSDDPYIKAAEEIARFLNNLENTTKKRRICLRSSLDRFEKCFEVEALPIKGYVATQV